MEPIKDGESLELKVRSSRFPSCEVSICLPVVRKNEWSVKVRLPGGDNDLPQRALAYLPKRFHDDSLLTTDLETFRRIILRGTGDDVVVPVKCMGRGPTDKSAKYRVTVRYHVPDRYRGFEEHDKVHTLTLAKSKLKEVEQDGAICLFMPTWVVRSALKRNEMIPEQQRVSFPRVTWLGERAFVAQLETSLNCLRQLEAPKEEELRRNEKWRLRREH